MDMQEDEKDPDVIPHGKKTEKALNAVTKTDNYGK